MLSMAPVASPTPIICVTMLGNTPHSRRGIDDGSAFFDGLAHLHQRFFQNRVARGSGGNRQAFENRHAGCNQRAERPGEAAHGDLAQQRSDDRDVEQSLVEVIAAARMLANLLEAEDKPAPAAQ